MFKRTTNRWCIHCKSLKSFHFNKGTGHSSCSICNSTFHISLEIYNDIINPFEKQISQLTQQVVDLKQGNTDLKANNKKLKEKIKA